MNLYLNDTQLEVKIDTGAEVTVSPESVATPFHHSYENLLEASENQGNLFTSLWRVHRNIAKRCMLYVVKTSTHHYWECQQLPTLTLLPKFVVLSWTELLFFFHSKVGEPLAYPSHSKSFMFYLSIPLFYAGHCSKAVSHWFPLTIGLFLEECCTKPI